jgi:hypothetical protein
MPSKADEAKGRHSHLFLTTRVLLSSDLLLHPQWPTHLLHPQNHQVLEKSGNVFWDGDCMRVMKEKVESWET